MRLYLGNLPYTIDDDGIRQFLSPFNVTSIHLPIDKEMGRPHGFAFAEVSDSDGPKVIAERHDTRLDGRRIIINEAKPREGGGGGNRGGGGGERRGGNGRRSSDRPDRSDKNDGGRRHGKRHNSGADFWRD